MEKDKKLYNEHDLGYKHILSHKKNFIDFLRSFVKKEWVDLIEEENLILIDKEFIQEDFKEEEADIVYKVNIDGKDIIFYVLLELQSRVDFRMPIRLLMYMTEIWRDELKNTEENIKKRKKYRLPVIVPIVLYNGKNRWTAVRSFKEILNGYELFEENVVDFKYLLFDVNRMDKEELLKIANVVSSVFLLDQDVEIEEIIKRLKLIGRIIRSNATKEQEKSFRSWLLNIFKNRFEGDKRDNIYKLLTEVSEMEVDDMVSNLGRKLEEEFKHREKKGIQRGIQRGIQQGIQQGKKEMVKNLLLLGVDIEKIIKASELSKEDVEKIKREMN
ncbi:Rpn family recombination-promoting nuclease/putative transposase [Crassaminicella thermophila]|uniref:Rpn family recombination-promoting nuclease/putative transposase n=1 Tax=Crassaminicella thermophila TaxID=2599308 RepID=A0A5C0SDK3_CRATE|nr:Rpn family recombination-promoting nuclease/putative transposase [Crassaminicella thermophila]QEK11324.1 Rpn family recombination-promoting nuclease/putative transposase [Crassaminicella thermophila]